MPIMEITIPPPITLVHPDGGAGEVQYFTKFVARHLLDQPRFRANFTVTKAAFDIERSLAAVPDADMGVSAVWELGGEEWRLLCEAIDHPEHLALADGATRVVPGFMYLPWAARQMLPFMEAIKRATERHR